MVIVEMLALAPSDALRYSPRDLRVLACGAARRIEQLHDLAAFVIASICNRSGFASKETKVSDLLGRALGESRLGIYRST